MPEYSRSPNTGSRGADGQLFVDLRGFADDEPVNCGDALTGFLHALGVPSGRVPCDVDERAALYRSVLDQRRVLVVLDNARSAEQVRPLLPGASGSAALISSRHRLDALVATAGASTIPVIGLDPEESVTALARVAGSRRVEVEPEAAADLVALCDRLPLAIRIAATRLAIHPQWIVRALADELADARHRLDALSLSPPGPSLTSVLEATYRRLTAPTREPTGTAGIGQRLDELACQDD